MLLFELKKWIIFSGKIKKYDLFGKNISKTPDVVHKYSACVWREIGREWRED